MRFLADENFPGAAVAALRAAGHDVIWIRTAAPGSTDGEVLAWAMREDRIVLTFDRDFGSLALRGDLPASSGVVLFRLPLSSVGTVGPLLAARLGERNNWAGHFSVIEPGRTRMRPLVRR